MKIKIADFSMEYCKFGTGSRAFVILPGLSIPNVLAFADAIAEAYRPLTEAFTVYVFERREQLPPSYTVYDTAEDTAAALRELGLQKVSLFGASYGGMAAMELAIRHPDLVENLVLASTSADLTEEEYRTVEGWLSLAEQGDAEALYHAFGEAVYPKEVYEQSRQLLTDAAKTVTNEDLTRFITLAKGMKGFHVSQNLAGLPCPVLAIGDQQDRVLGPEAAEAIGDLMKPHPDFTLYLYDGYGHAVYDMAPDFKERILAFLTRNKA